jgi:hypothetical protein
MCRKYGYGYENYRKELLQTMGMSASQARLLSITARLSNNELEQQSVA